MQQAAFQDRLARLTVQGDFGALSEQVAAIYGLVAKASTWYVVYAVEGRVRARRVSRIVAAELLPEHFARPADFDLAAFWQAWCTEVEQDRPRFEVRALVAPVLKVRLDRLLEGKLPDLLNTPPELGREGWQEARLTFESFETARTRLLGFGGAIEVLEPLALRESLRDYARQIGKIYETAEFAD